MKKVDKRWILFLVLIVALASGLSFLSLHQETETENPNRTQTMAIAIVNEDQGSTFNGTDLAFGDAFTQSINRNNNHEWFVVSRGVAESGLENNTYDMMVVIPNDFSEKSLNINAENPEPVVLQYKINASENARIKEEAEKTASNILNDFNRRIIDVYFASVIGNLQDAQDNVSEMVNRQALHTNAFNSNVSQPLSGYTDQFNTIKDQTEHSTNSFSSFEELIESYENQLLEEAEQGEAFVSNIEDVVELKENNLSQLLAFNDMFSQFNQGMRASGVNQKLDNLRNANEEVNRRLGSNDGNSEQILSMNLQPESSNLKNSTQILKLHLNETKRHIDNTEANVDKTIEELSTKLSNIIQPMVKDQIENDDIANVLISASDISKYTTNLMTYDNNELEGIGLPNGAIQELSNVIEISNIFNKDFNKDSTSGNQLNDLLYHLQANGFSVSDSVNLVESDKIDSQSFEIQYDKDKFSLSEFKITYKNLNGEQKTQKSKVDKVTGLPPMKENFKVEATFNLIGDTPIVYQPFNWGWELSPEKIEDKGTAIIEPVNTRLIANKEVNSQDNDSELQNSRVKNTNLNKNQTENLKEEQGTGQGENPKEEQGTGQGENPKEEQGTGQDENPKEEQGTGQGENPKEEQGAGQGENPKEEQGADQDENPKEEENIDQDESEEIEEIELINNRYINKISTTPDNLDKETLEYITNVKSGLSDYYKLSSLFGNYFDLNMNNLPSELDLLQRMKEFLPEVIATSISEQIVNRITDEMTLTFSSFKDQTIIFKENITVTYENVENLLAQINEAAKQAATLNTNLTQTIDEVQSWRDEAMSLLEQQQDIQASAEGEQNAVMTLGSDFQPILSSSQNLADQASNNLNTAENVYQTFEDIDNQATEIEQSGTNLVSNAENLAVEMTDKLENDETFIENFTGVLANSRVGDRQNENLYDFLSNPVETSNEGTITTQNNTFTPYFLVLISFIVVLFTAYVISTINQKKVNQDQFASEASLMSTNMPITIITVGIGILEGIVIGIVSSYYLPISDLNMLQLTIIMALLVTGMLLVATYLLRQIKMIGMFLLLAVFSLYLFFTDALGSGTAPFPLLEKLSPLQYMETFLLRIVEGTVNYGGAIFIVLMLLLIGALGNLLVINRPDREEEMTDENQAEAG